MQKTYLTIIRERTAVEAGWVLHDDDLGKETIHGITVATAKEHMHLWTRFGFNGDMKTMPVEMAYEIYKVSWWDKMYLSDVMHLGPTGPWLAERLFDFGINCGRGKAVEAIQSWLNVLNRQGKDYPDMLVDGIMGNTTLTAMRAFCERNPSGIHKLYTVVTSSQQQRYKEISIARERNESFTNGWINRVDTDARAYWKAAG